jgi:hypothetical protein
MFDLFEQFCRAHEKTIAGLGACGTWAAIIVAIWLARRQSRIRFVINVDLRPRVVHRVQEECLSVQINNLGLISASVGRLQWSAGFWPRRRYLEQAPDQVSPQGAFPRELSPGQQIDFYFPLSESGSAALHRVAQMLGKRMPFFLSARSVRLSVYANNRIINSVRIAPAVRRELLDHWLLLVPIGRLDAMTANDAKH